MTGRGFDWRRDQMPCYVSNGTQFSTDDRRIVDRLMIIFVLVLFSKAPHLRMERKEHFHTKRPRRSPPEESEATSQTFVKPRRAIRGVLPAGRHAFPTVIPLALEGVGCPMPFMH